MNRVDVTAIGMATNGEVADESCSITIAVGLNIPPGEHDSISSI